MDDKNLTQLNQFTGTEHWYKHPLFLGKLYTDGARYVAQNASAYWLIEMIFSLQLKEEIGNQPFQVWTLTVNENGSAVLRAEDGNDSHLYSETLSYTDFPKSGITLWYSEHVLLLPSEY